jgi:hypothetical protein
MRAKVEHPLRVVKRQFGKAGNLRTGLVAKH